MKKFYRALFVGLLSVAVFAGCGAKGNVGEDEKKVIKVGASPSPHADILKQAAPILEEEGYELDIVEFVDFVQPNLALESGELDANYFQHKPYLENFNIEKGTNLVAVGDIHYELFGIYPGKTKSLDELKEGAKIVVPNDTTNEARALLLLEAQGLIQLKEDAGLEATTKDIVKNDKNLDIIEIEAAQLPHSLSDVDLAVINGNYALSADLTAEEDAIAVEDIESIGVSTYVNVVAVKAGNEENEATKALVKALKSETVQKYIEDTYAGGVIGVK